MTSSDNEDGEISRLLRQLTVKVHRLSTRDALTVMDVDERLRRGMLRPGDLDRLQGIELPG